MKAITILMEEHQLILKVLDALEVFAAGVKSNETDDISEFGRFADYFSNFADKFHHAKEEDILYEEMQKFGFSKESGPLAVMLDDHNFGRKQVGIMRETGNNPGGDGKEDAVEAANKFIEMLRSHISKEDNILYPMAVQQLPNDLMENMPDRFEKFESDKTGSAGRDALYALGENLVSKYCN